MYGLQDQQIKLSIMPNITITEGLKRLHGAQDIILICITHYDVMNSFNFLFLFNPINWLRLKRRKQKNTSILCNISNVTLWSPKH